MSARLSRGVTLVDLTVVLAIVGILASVALPTYQSQLARSRRAEAIGALTQFQASQEQYRAQHGRYALRADALRGLAPRGAHYELVLVSGHVDGYVARALSLAGPRDDGWNR
jgi:type IV pilus assembly protein PilE